MHFLFRFPDRATLSNAYTRAQSDPRVEACSVDVPQLSLSVRVAGSGLARDIAGQAGQLSGSPAPEPPTPPRRTRRKS
jgi:hypothetical protein